ncbi:AAA family ATPase [Streptomyces sp. GQFP]|uniref:AAA family ATPase n=1 Tax=Streptomyces sp. GQFP TaxID=2907545 RepID=UPI001F22C693|nr:AAA family ATPase [Streptomyces sp. GQFP]UIX32917.1 AAA family ATPase [Streptomyces sp. GQFP]
MITRIEIDGFKTFDDFSLDLPPFLVLLGANGSGKSNLLEAVALLGQLVREPSSQTLVRYARRGGPRELFRRGPDGELVDEIRIGATVLVQAYQIGAVHMRVDVSIGYREAPEPLTVDLSFEAVDSHRLEVSPKTAEQIDSNAAILQSWTGPRSETDNHFVMLATSGLGHSASNWWILDPVPEAMRQPADAYDSDRLAEDGRNLGAVLGRLWEGDPERKWAFEADVSALLPDVREIDVVRDHDRAQWDIWVQYKHEPRMAPRVVSGGTLRMLALLAAAHDPDHPGVLMFEEPENGLYPSRVPRLLERLRGHATDLGSYEPAKENEVRRSGVRERLRQILVTSHSPVVLASLLDDAPHDVVFLDTVTRLGEGKSPARLTRARKVAEGGERGTYVTPIEVRQYLDPVGYAHGA